MYRIFPYIALFVVTILVQVFLLDNLSISIYFAPMIYLALLLLLPLDMPHIGLLAAGLVTGWMMDGTMGTDGLNVIATLPVAFLRPWIIGLFYTREDPREGGIPSAARFGKVKFIRYIAVCVLLHHSLFFSFEALSWVHAARTLLRIVVSGAASVYFIWLTARLFTLKLTVRV